MSDGWWLVVIAVIFVVIMFFIGITYSQQKYEIQCAAKGGQVLDMGRGYLCLTNDGRIIR